MNCLQKNKKMHASDLAEEFSICKNINIILKISYIVCITKTVQCSVTDNYNLSKPSIQEVYQK